MTLDKVDQKRAQNVDLGVAEALPQLVPISRLSARARSRMRLLPRQFRALQEAQRDHVVHESSGGLWRAGHQHPGGAAAGHCARDGQVAEAQYDAGVDRPGSFR